MNTTPELPLGEPPHGVILLIPVGAEPARIPFPMTEERYDLLMKTLRLWKSQLIAATPIPDSPQEIPQ